MSFLLGAKPGDHQHLFEQVIEQMEHDKHLTETYQVASAKQTIRTETNYIAGVSLNKSHSDLRVNFLQHYEFEPQADAVVKRFSWITDIDLSQKSLYEYQKASRCRWRVENETFNTLKNQGYHLERNYGHGKQNLSTVLALLMFLAFTVPIALDHQDISSHCVTSMVFPPTLRSYSSATASARKSNRIKRSQ